MVEEGSVLKRDEFINLCCKGDKVMIKKAVTVIIILLFPLLSGLSYKSSRISLWERMCEACHDGSTVLNGKVVIDKEQIKAKYQTLDELVNAVTCEGPPCMNILKHDEKLVRKVGKEIGIRETAPAK
jgi:hypothetical protein